MQKQTYVFREYRDKAGIGSEKLFDTKEEAIEYAQKEWNHLSEHDKKNYRNDVAGTFMVGLANMVWEEVGEEYVAEPELEEIYWSSL